MRPRYQIDKARISWTNMQMAPRTFFVQHSPICLLKIFIVNWCHNINHSWYNWKKSHGNWQQTGGDDSLLAGEAFFFKFSQFGHQSPKLCFKKWAGKIGLTAESISRSRRGFLKPAAATSLREGAFEGGGQCLPPRCQKRFVMWAPTNWAYTSLCLWRYSFEGSESCPKNALLQLGINLSK